MVSIGLYLLAKSVDRRWPSNINVQTVNEEPAVIKQRPEPRPDPVVLCCVLHKYNYGQGTEDVLLLFDDIKYSHSPSECPLNGQSGVELEPIRTPRNR